MERSRSPEIARDRGAAHEDAPVVGARPAPRLAVQREAGPAIAYDAELARRTFADAVNVGIHRAIQREAGGIVEAPDVATRAARGVRGGGGPLPHLAQIQSAFGKHDVGGIRAFVGGDATEAARSIGARAYAMGDAVAFAGAPDLRQAAHEAAHVVQQRGGVQLDGGVGEVGDRYERHADDVAEAVVHGRSAEALLTPFAGGGGGGGGVQRDPEPIAQLDQAVDAVQVATVLRPTLTAIDRFRPRPHDHRTELVVPIAGADHHVAPGDLPELRQHVMARLTALGAVRDAAGAQAIIDAAIEAIESNESGGAAVAGQSTMDTSAPNPAEPERGQHASYASASQMIPSHAIGSLRGSAGGREVAAEQGLDEHALADASATVNASNRIWDAVVVNGWTYARLVGDTRRDGRARDMQLTAFTEADIARMAEFRAFRHVLESQRARVETVRDEVEAGLVAQGNEVEAQIAAMRAEPAPVPPPRHGHGHDAPAPATEPASAAPATHHENPTAAPDAHAGDAHEADAHAGDAHADASDAHAAEDRHAALAQLSPRILGQVAGIRTFARPATWSTMTAAQRRTWLTGATGRLRSARGHIHHVSCSAADALIAYEVSTDPAVAAMHFDTGTIRAYIHSEAHFMQRWHEDRGGWSRRALQNHPITPAADGSARTLDSAIAAAASAGGGHRLTRIDLESNLRAYLEANPFASPEDVVSRAASVNSGGSSEYRTHILQIFHRLHPSWATEHPPASAAPPLQTTLQ